MERWIKQSLSEILDYPVTDEMIKYIMTIENERDLDEFLKNSLDGTNTKHKNFTQELKKRRAHQSQFVGYRKPNDNVESLPKSRDKKKSKPKEKEPPSPPQEKSEKPPQRSDKSEKRKKFVNLYSAEGKEVAVLLKGRVRCDCEAKSHRLINNCLSCGRIVCAQEGAGPCFFCEELVCTPSQQEILSSKSRASDALYNKLMEQQKPSKSATNALKQRDRLLEFDRNSASRTKVIDDESDYYQSNTVWLSKEERADLERRETEMREKKHGSRLNRKLVVDIFGREIQDEEDPVEAFQRRMEALEEKQKGDARLVCPGVEINHVVYTEGKLTAKIPSTNSAESTIHRVQDRQLIEMADDGLCLSMHQPWASLLISGIKKHEGRTWYSSHRGRLWIHAAAKIPTPEEVSTLEQRYRVLVDESLVFPQSYPTKVLLGYVTVLDVLPQVEYRKLYPTGESDSPFVFICDDFCELPIKFPMDGKMKIFKLDKKLHQAALTSFERFSKVIKN